MTRIAIDLPPDQVAELDRLAEEDGLTRADVVRKALAWHLERTRKAADKLPD